MLLQQSTRRHLPRHSLNQEARMRTFFAGGRESLDFPPIITFLTLLVQIAVIIFLVGLLIYMSNVNYTVFKIALAWVVLSMWAYFFITMLPIFRPDTPFRTPLSNVILLIHGAILRSVCQIIWLTTRAIFGRQERCFRWKDRYHDWMSRDLVKLAEERARELSSRIDGKVLKQTLDGLRGDHDLEQFLEALPGFCDSEIVDDAQRSLNILGRQRLAEAVVGFWDHALSSNLVPESVKTRRLITCLRVIEAADLGIAVPLILNVLFFRGVGGISRSPELGYSLGKLRYSNIASLARAIIAGIITHAERDGRWFALAMEELGVSEDVLRNYLAHGDSVLLANLINITRHFFNSLLEGHRDLARESLCILPWVSKLDILNTLPELQHSFCNLWDLIVQQTWNNGANDKAFIEILVQIRPLYVTLYPANATTPYVFTPALYNAHTLRRPISSPLRETAEYQPNSSSLMAEATVGTTAGISHVPPITFPTFPIHEPSRNNLPGVLQLVSSPAVATVTSFRSSLESQSPSPMSPFTRNGGTPNCTDTSPESVTVRVDHIAHTPSNASIVQPPPDDGTTGAQTGLVLHQNQSEPCVGAQAGPETEPERTGGAPEMSERPSSRSDVPVRPPRALRPRRRAQSSLTLESRK